MIMTATDQNLSVDIEPLAVSPRQACALLSIGNTRLYALLATGELKSYRDGRSRRITMASIRDRFARLLALQGKVGSPTQPARSHRTQPRKVQPRARQLE